MVAAAGFGFRVGPGDPRDDDRAGGAVEDLERGDRAVVVLAADAEEPVAQRGFGRELGDVQARRGNRSLRSLQNLQPPRRYLRFPRCRRENCDSLERASRFCNRLRSGKSPPGRPPPGQNRAPPGERDRRRGPGQRLPGAGGPSGLRLGELVALDVDDVTLSARKGPSHGAARAKATPHWEVSVGKDLPVGEGRRERSRR